MKKTFIIKSKIWRWPGMGANSVDGGWHFVTLDKKLSTQIRHVYTRGHIPIVAKVLKSTWNASLLWHGREGVYILCITKKVRKDQGLFPGDEIKVSVVIK